MKTQREIRIKKNPFCLHGGVGDTGTLGLGDMGTWRPEDMWSRGHGNIGICGGDGDSGTRGHVEETETLLMF